MMEVWGFTNFNDSSIYNQWDLKLEPNYTVKNFSEIFDYVNGFMDGLANSATTNSLVGTCLDSLTIFKN